APESKIITIHNGVEILDEEFMPSGGLNQRFTSRRGNKSSGENESKSLEGNKSDKVQIVFVGRLSDQKDPEKLIKAFFELSDPIKNMAEIKIIGDGPKREKLENIIKTNNLEDKVKLLGNLPRDQVFEELKKSDIFTLISHYEGFPRSILEAMSVGLPIIASNVGGVSEAVSGENGFVVNREDFIGLKDALEKLILDDGMRERLGIASHEKVVRDFSLEKMLEETEKVYNEVLGN
ncbi:MAG: glycosyltransferase family 4 protein, partial [Candidatus Paceibacterota bacterium]